MGRIIRIIHMVYKSTHGESDREPAPLRNDEEEIAAIISLIYETIFSPKGLPGFVDVHPLDPEGRRSFAERSLQDIVPFLERALLTADGSRGDSREEVPRAVLLEELPLAVCIVSRELRLLSATRRAREHLEVGSTLSLVDETVHAADRQFHAELIRAVRSTIDSGRSRAIRGEDASGQVQTFLTAPVSWEADQPAAALFMNIELGVFDRLSASLVDEFDLTRSEAEVTSHLAQGLSIEEIASRKGASISTVRTQIKSVFAKTGTKRQGELVSLVLNGPALWLRLARGRDVDPVDEGHGPDRLLHLDDGRLLSFADYGPVEGQPVFLFHHLIGSRKEKPIDDGLLDRLGIRLIVPERPGVGRSSSMEERRLADCADDIRQLADHLALDRFHVLGFSSGGPHAAACTAFLEDRVVGLGLAASLMPIDELPDGVSTSLTQRFMTGMARHWPAGIQSLLELRYRRLLSNPVAAMAGFEREGSRADIELLRDPEISRIRLMNLKNGTRIPERVFASELVLLSQPWGFRLSEIATPVRIWHGRQDDFFSAAHAEAMAATLPNCRAFFSDDWGHFFLYREWERVLSELVA